MDRRVLIVIGLMKSNLHQELSLDALAQSVGLSRWHLCHLFRAAVEVSPAHYLKSLRMREAKELLETTHLSVKQIMLKVGMKDKSHFERDFKRTYGLTPAQYRSAPLDNLCE